MALYHDATVAPTKADMLSAWVPTQAWNPERGRPTELIGAFRFDDPEGQVGIESFLVSAGDHVLHVPVTYRAEPLAGAEAALICQMEHSALGTRWVYDGLHDARYLMMVAAVAMTGQGESLGMVDYDGRWHVAPSNIRLQGGGWTQERVPVDGFTQVAPGGDAVFVSERFELTVHRRPRVGARPALGLAAHWAGQAEPVVVAQVRELTNRPDR